MRYKIGEIAKLFGLNTETLRYYEKNNLVKTERDTSNNYRYFDLIALQTLSSIKRFRNMNFSLGEIEQIHRKVEIEDIVYLMENKIADYYAELSEKQAIIDRMQENKKLLANLSSYIDNPILLENQVFYYHSFSFENEHFGNETIVNQLFQKFPLSSSTTKISREILENGKGKKERGLILEGKHSSYFNDLVNEMTRIEMKRCVKITFEISDGDLSLESTRRELMKFLIRHRLMISGDSYTVHVMNYREEEIAKHIGNLYIPVTEIK